MLYFLLVGAIKKQICFVNTKKKKLNVNVSQ